MSTLKTHEFKKGDNTYTLTYDSNFSLNTYLQCNNHIMQGNMALAADALLLAAIDGSKSSPEILSIASLRAQAGLIVMQSYETYETEEKKS